MQLINKTMSYILPVFPKAVVGYFAKPYIAGERLDDAVDIVRELMQEGACATLDVLGEEDHHEEQALHAVELYKQVLQRIYSEKLHSGISVKPTHMGLKIDKEFCYKNIRSLVEMASLYKRFVRIDMEDHTTTQDTIDIYKRLREDFDNVGTVLQAYLRRTVQDINGLIPLKADLRLCKGIYIEPRSVAWKDGGTVNQNFAYTLEKLIVNNCYVGIATHDEKLVWEAMRILDKYQVKKDRYEFQMLLGVDADLRRIIIDSGHKLRVYVPFGAEWFAYSTRRLKENPAIAGHIMGNLFTSIFKRNETPKVEEKKEAKAKVDAGS